MIHDWPAYALMLQRLVGDAAAKTRAAERFRRAQKAYATLGDKEKSLSRLCCGRKDEIEELVDLEKPQFWDGSISSKTIRLSASGGALEKMGQLIVLDQKSIFCNWPFRVDLGPKSGSVRTRFREFSLEMECGKLR